MLSQAAKPGRVRLTLSRSGQAVALHDVPLRSAEFEARLEVANPDPWSPDSAKLYDFTVELVRRRTRSSTAPNDGSGSGGSRPKADASF